MFLVLGLFVQTLRMANLSFQIMVRHGSLGRLQKSGLLGRGRGADDSDERPPPAPPGPPSPMSVRESDMSAYEPSGDSDNGSSEDSELVQPGRFSSPSCNSEHSEHGSEVEEPQPGPSSERESSVGTDAVPGVSCGPTGEHWTPSHKYVACRCGMLINEKRVPRHIESMCRLNPSPLADIRPDLKKTVTWMRVNAEKRVKCAICNAVITATEQTTIAKSIATHLSKKHRKLSSRKRDKVRRRIFNENHVLTATDVATAVKTGLKLDSRTYDKVAKSRVKHGSSKAQAEAPTPEQSREEFVLRNSVSVHPRPHRLFMVRGLFAEIANPSRATMSFLNATEQGLKLDVLDWRYIFATTDMRRRIREYLNESYDASPSSGFMRASSLRKFVRFVRGHLAEVTDGEAWKPLVEMVLQLIDAIIKENKDKVDKCEGEREVRHMTEQRLSYTDRVLIEKSVLQNMKRRSEQPVPDEPADRRRTAVWYRQAAYVALCVKQSHRTGVYLTLTVDEFKRAVRTENGLVINHVGGKTRGKHRTVQVPIRRKLHALITWYLRELQPCLGRTDEAGLLLFPHLNAFDPDSLNLRIEEIQHLNYPALLRGNKSRRQHVELAHDLDEANELHGTSTRELAALRCHSEAVAARTYDARNKAERASRATKAFLDAANKRYGLVGSPDDEDNETGEPDQTAEPDDQTAEPDQTAESDVCDAETAVDDSFVLSLPSCSSRKRYADVFNSDDDEPTEKTSRPGPSGGAGDGPPRPSGLSDEDEAHGIRTAPSPDPEPVPLALADTTTRPSGLGLGYEEPTSGLIVDEALLPFLEEARAATDSSYSRTGRGWTTVERATLFLALQLGVSDGKGKEEKVRNFLQGRPGWDMSNRTPLQFLAQLCKMRRQMVK